MRLSGRKLDELRDVSIEINFSKHAEGSCMISFGDTKIICTATIDERVPPFLRGKNKGWVTAEYSMLPRATNNRVRRDSQTGKPSGRTHEIQRLIVRSLRAITDLKLLGERQIIVDCDVIQADGGTRTASITGGYIALYLACQKLLKSGQIKEMPLISEVAAISCGIYKGEALLDLDYIEDSDAEVDANFVLNAQGKIIEIQGTAEQEPFSQEQLLKMLELATNGTKILNELQRKALE